MSALQQASRPRSVLKDTKTWECVIVQLEVLKDTKAWEAEKSVGAPPFWPHYNSPTFRAEKSVRVPAF